MKIFIFHKIDQVSKSYHSDGSVVAIAESKEDLINLIEETNKTTDDYLGADIQLTEKDWANVEVYELAGKDNVRKVWIMENAGCC